MRFHEANQLSCLAPYLPTGDFRLPSSCYELVLEDFLRKNDNEVSRQDNVFVWSSYSSVDPFFTKGCSSSIPVLYLNSTLHLF